MLFRSADCQGPLARGGCGRGGPRAPCLQLSGGGQARDERGLARGECAGWIVDAERGSRGFGYDPVFAPTVDGAPMRTFAEMSEAEKNAVSHRGRAFRNLVRMFAEYPETGSGWWTQA